jgi:hypothetical protein
MISTSQPSAPKQPGAGTKLLIDSTFQKLRDRFPEDVRFLNAGSSAMSIWPDFADISIYDPHITVPLHAVLDVHGLSFVHTEEFSRFFPQALFGSFDVIQAFILPQYSDNAECNTLLRSLAAHTRVPSMEFSCRHYCSVVVVLSCIDSDTLSMQAACSLLPMIEPRLSEKLLYAALDLYEENILQHGSSRALLRDECTSSALLAALKRFVQLSSGCPTGPALVADEPVAAPQTLSLDPKLFEVDAQDYVGKWYQAFVVEGAIGSSDAVRVHFMVTTPPFP